ncbi:MULTISPECIES: hypothetical protein [Haloferax]|uniref:Uncharacterized protein n=1 Tax=Haloferax marinum TaxID=2666143 RepID=A0A6A8G9K6_9EURY|nr:MULTISPECIES: hypothetical protein [Haloferax]KAB1198299.1 hypothetical protein Hfx1150_12565 [Haloferax sp. CBA1150]MRW97395.1 hypothetical protein [Haloferax marinum]
MIRMLMAVFGIVELLFPDQLIDTLTKIAYEGGDEMNAKPWVTTVARIEGAVFLFLALFVVGKRCGGDSDEE